MSKMLVTILFCGLCAYFALFAVIKSFRSRLKFIMSKQRRRRPQLIAEIKKQMDLQSHMQLYGPESQDRLL